MNGDYDAKTNKGFLFQAKTDEAFVIKILGELLAQRLKFAPFKVTPDGIFLLKMDPKKQQLIEIALEKTNFSPYKCSKTIIFSVNTTYFYKMLKCIKKKDGLRLFIHEDDPHNLGICIEQKGEGNKVNTFLKITMTHPEDIQKPDGYDPPIIIQSKQFQKMKNLHSISDTMTITSKLNYIKFFCDGGELYSRELVIGEENDEDNSHIKNVYKQTFNTQHITGLAKCAGQSYNVQVFVHEDLGLKIKMKAGSLGEITVYIKSKELIQDEEEERVTQDEEISDLAKNMQLRNEDDEEEEEDIKKPKVPAKRQTKKLK